MLVDLPLSSDDILEGLETEWEATGALPEAVVLHPTTWQRFLRDLRFHQTGGITRIIFHAAPGKVPVEQDELVPPDHFALRREGESLEKAIVRMWKA